MQKNTKLRDKGLSVLGASYTENEMSPIRAQYFYNFLSQFKATDPALKIVLGLLDRQGSEFLGGALDNFTDAHEEKIQKIGLKTLSGYLAKAEADISKDAFDTLRDELKDGFKTANPEADNTSHENIKKIADALMLKDVEKDLLIFLDNVANDYGLNRFIASYVEKDTKKIPYLLSLFIYGDFDKADDISKAIDHDGALIKYDLMTPLMLYKHENEDAFAYDFSYAMHSLSASTALTKDDIVKKLIGEPTKTDVNLDDFPHLKQQLHKIKSDIQTAVQGQKTGINILLYGPAGTGKTTLAAAIAKELEIDIYSVAEQHNQPEYDADGDTKKEKVADYRRRKLTAAHDLLAGKQAIVLFDEAEDLTMKGGQKSDVDDKIGTNRLVENNPIVTIYACNDMDRFHESFLQRFTHIVNVPRTPAVVRKQQWATQARIHGLQLSDESFTRLGRKYEIPARMIAHSIATIKDLRPHLTNDDDILTDIDEYLRSKGAGVYNDANSVEDAQALPDTFSTTFITASAQDDVKRINAAINDNQKTTVLIQGKPGSGLTTTTRHIADEMAGNLIETSAHEILNPPPMSSPMAVLKGAFAAAANQNAPLVIHGIDQFTNDASKPNDFHKSPMLNVIFKQMTAHHSPVILATINPDVKIDNLFKSRFSTTLELGALNQDQAIDAIEHFFGQTIDSNALDGTEIFISDVKQAYNTYHTSGTPDDFDIVASIKEFSALRNQLTHTNTGIGFSADIK